MDRRKLTTLDRLKIVVAQSKCPICGEKLGDLSGLDFDHEIALVNGGTDTLDNMRAVHRADCHKRKTHGNGATIAGSDRGKAIKTKRLVEKRLAREAEAEKEFITVANSEIDEIRELPSTRSQKIKSKIPSRPRPQRKPQARATGYKRKGV